MGKTTEQIEEVLEEADRPLTPKQISKRVYGKERSLSQQLHSLIAWNSIEKVGPGKYVKR